MTPTDAALAEAARAWVRLRDEAVALRRRRKACVCEQHENVVTDGGASWTTGTPCWKRWKTDHATEDSVLAPKGEWCVTCLLRQQVHEEYLATTRKRGTALRRIVMLGRQA